MNQYKPSVPPPCLGVEVAETLSGAAPQSESSSASPTWTCVDSVQTWGMLFGKEKSLVIFKSTSKNKMQEISPLRLQEWCVTLLYIITLLVPSQPFSCAVTQNTWSKYTLLVTLQLKRNHILVYVPMLPAVIHLNWDIRWSELKEPVRVWYTLRFYILTLHSQTLNNIACL